MCMEDDKKKRIITVLPIKIIRDVEGEIGEIVASVSENTNRDEEQDS